MREIKQIIKSTAALTIAGRAINWKSKKWHSIIPVLSCWWCLYSQAWSSSVLLKFLKLIETWETNNGLIWTINHIKSLRLHATKWIANEPIASPSPYRIRVDKTGWPMCIKFIKPDKGDLHQYRIILTILSIMRAFEGGTPEDLTAIEDPCTGMVRESLACYSRTFSRRVRRFPLKEWSYHFTTKMGPNGHAIASSISDASVISLDNIQACDDISPGIGKAITHFRILISKYPKEIQYVTDSRPVAPGTEVPARIVSIPAPEGKTRVIAQQGYFVQAALLPLHESLIKTLKSLPQDLTYRQQGGPSRLKIEEGNSFHSFDLKSATDRFPLELQVRLLEQIYSKSLAIAWQKLIRTPHHFGDKVVTYGAGQPMGAYSSWAVFTLTHHIVVQWCIRRVNPKEKRCYIILGDDIVISNDCVARLYLRVIDEIGVEISAMKTHTSKECYEIAKRWYMYRTGEYSPFSVHAIVAAGSNTSQVYQAVHDSLIKGWMNAHSVSRVTAFMTTAKRTGKTINYGVWPHNETLASLFDVVAKTIRGYIPGVEMLRAFQQKFKLPVLPALSPSHYVNSGVVNNIVVELFTESAERTGEGNQNVAITTILWLTDPSTEIPISVDEAKACIPHLGIYAKFEKTYLDIQTKVLSFDTLFNGEWDLAIRSLLVPDTTTVFSARKTDVRNIVCSILVKKIAQRVKLIATLPNPI